jgi:hypothetical protein
MKSLSWVSSVLQVEQRAAHLSEMSLQAHSMHVFF